MNKKTQQRIVGSIAIIAILFLVLPYLFSTKTSKITDVAAPTPTTDTTTQNNNNTDSNFWDQREENVIVHIDPIPNANDSSIPTNTTGTTASETPVSETIWNEVTQSSINNAQTSISDSRSVAEQILSEANVTSPQTQSQAPKFTQPNVNQPKTQTKPNNTAQTTQPKTNLPTLNLISTAQPKTSAKPVASTQKAQSSFTWYIQVGSFSNKEGAVKTLNDFRKKGYEAVISEFKSASNAQRFYQVRLGPYKSRENAQRVQADLRRQNLQPILIEIK